MQMDEFRGSRSSTYGDLYLPAALSLGPEPLSR